MALAAGQTCGIVSRVTSERGWAESNRAFWDERVPLHVGGEFYGVEGFKAGEDPLRGRPFEIAEMGSVAGKTLVHLQCHFGLDTFAWARRGARVTGLDFSGPAVEAARALATETGIAADFVQADVYDACDALAGRQFDIVYTGRGALCWLADIRRWAAVVAALLKPGGFLYLSEFHPIADVFADESLEVRYPYFHQEPMCWDEPGSYASTETATTHNRTFEWTHGLGEVVTAIIGAGLRLEFLHEFDYTGFQRWPFLEKEAGTGIYRLPGGTSLPLAYTLKASKS